MIFKKYIIDVGANNGIDGLAMAMCNKSYFIHAFEPNKVLCKQIKKLKIKLEKRRGIKILNYKIHNFAISDKNKISILNISVNNTVSSLNKLSNNLDKYWPGYKDAVFKIEKKVKVRTITLFDFMKKKKIKHINYLHIDTQGHDLKVINGLKNKINSVYAGKLEASLNKKLSAYKNNHTVDDIKKKFNKTDLIISKIKKINMNSNIGIFNNEADIFFKNKFKKNHDLNLKYNSRYFVRVMINKTYFKDDFFDYIKKKINYMFFI